MIEIIKQTYAEIIDGLNGEIEDCKQKISCNKEIYKGKTQLPRPESGSFLKRLQGEFIPSTIMLLDMKSLFYNYHKISYY